MQQWNGGNPSCMVTLALKQQDCTTYVSAILMWCILSKGNPLNTLKFDYMDTSLYHSSTKIQNAKRRFITAHARAMQIAGKIRVRRKELLWSQQEFSALEELATLYDRQLAVYLRNLIYTGITGIPIIPIEYEKTVRSLSQSIMRIANNVNQLVRYVHSSKSVSVENIEQIYYKIAELETEVKNHLHTIINESKERSGNY